MPVFPLSDFVLFPRAVAPIHVSELHDRTLVRDALRADRLVAFAVLLPGWDRGDRGTPRFHPIGCLAHVDHATWLPSDCYDLRITGLSRVRIGRVAREYPYRAARVTPVPQEPLSDDDPVIELERQALADARERLAAARRGLPSAPPVGLEAPAPGTLEEFVNTLCIQLAMRVEEKLALLELDSLLERSRHVREWIERDLRSHWREQRIDRN